MSRKRKKNDDGDTDFAGGNADEATAEADPNDPDREPPPKRRNAPRSLFVRSLPADATTEILVEHFSQSYPIKHATVVVDPTTKKTRGYGFVTFADAEDTQSAQKEFDGSLLNGKNIRVEVAEPRHRNTGDDGSKTPPSAEFLKTKEQRRQQRENQPLPKLIVRNLPWSIKTNEQLAHLFMSYGKIKDVTLPNTKPGLSPGFGFVLLRGRKNAEKAMAAINGKEVDGRTLAVDWAVNKDVWQAAQNTEPGKEIQSNPAVRADDKELDDIEDENSSNEDIMDEEYEIDADLGSESSSEREDQDLKSDGDEDFENEDRSSTIFIRNLPFTSTDDTLFHHFQAFGVVRYARVVIDYETERSRGTGFVCFYKPDDAKDCIRKSPRSNNLASDPKGKPSNKHSLLEDTAADPSGLFTIEGRVLQVSAAVGKTEAHRLTMEGKTAREARDRDKRRLYLLSEGTINPKSPMYSDMSPAELKMREASAKQRQTLIKSNPSLHISLTRLSIRNVPRFVSSKDLKALAREAVVGFARDVKEGRRSALSNEELSRGGDEMKEAERARKARGKGVVKQAKVVFEGRDGSKVDEAGGAGRSRGYGFIEYSSHRWALMGLRYLNGHRVSLRDGDTRSDDRPKRLIVEFSIENAQVVARRRDREERARERSNGAADDRQLESGPPKSGKKALSKNRLKNRAKVEAKRKREEIRSNPKISDSTLQDKEKASKTSKRQKIIGRKRAMRKARKKAS